MKEALFAEKNKICNHLMFSSALSPKISDIPSVNKTLSLKKPRFISKAGHNM